MYFLSFSPLKFLVFGERSGEYGAKDPATKNSLIRGYIVSRLELSQQRLTFSGILYQATHTHTHRLPQPFLLSLCLASWLFLATRLDLVPRWSRPKIVIILQLSKKQQRKAKISYSHPPSDFPNGFYFALSRSRTQFSTDLAPLRCRTDTGGRNPITTTRKPDLSSTSAELAGPFRRSVFVPRQEPGYVLQPCTTPRMERSSVSRIYHSPIPLVVFDASSAHFAWMTTPARLEEGHTTIFPAGRSVIDLLAKRGTGTPPTFACNDFRLQLIPVLPSSRA